MDHLEIESLVKRRPHGGDDTKDLSHRSSPISVSLSPRNNDFKCSAPPGSIRSRQHVPMGLIAFGLAVYFATLFCTRPPPLPLPPQAFVRGGTMRIPQQRVVHPIHTVVFDSEVAASYFDYSRALQPLQHMLEPDYGGLAFQSLLLRHDFERSIREDDFSLYHSEYKKIAKAMEKHDLRSKEKYDPFDDLDFPRECVRPQWTFEIYQSCNSFHDLTFDFMSSRSPSPDRFYSAKYLGSGAFRDSFMFTPSDTRNVPFVIKTKVYERDLDRRDFHKTNTEARIMEALSASPRTSNIYGHCGSSILVEPGREIFEEIIPYSKYARGDRRGRISQADLDKIQQDDVHPLNDYTVEKKLDVAIAMAESLAEMHGYEGGVMINDDISLYQWLYAADGRVMLNDFNDAMYMEWNYEKKEYCKYWRSFGGTFKAPEEYDGDYLDESVDVWPMGNIIFGLLTGLYPYYHLSDDSDIQNATKKGPPYIDPRYQSRSYVEGRMVEIMNQCHKLNATDRVDIFEVVRHLRETRDRHQM